MPPGVAHGGPPPPRIEDLQLALERACGAYQRVAPVRLPAHITNAAKDQTATYDSLGAAADELVTLAKKL
jgi:hypothetical protein